MHRFSNFFCPALRTAYDASHFTVPPSSSHQDNVLLARWLVSVSTRRKICEGCNRQPNWSSSYGKKKFTAYQCAHEKKHVHFRPLEFLWIFPWECSALARCSLGLRQWTARRRGKSYGATRRRNHPFAIPYAADSPVCGTDADPHRRVFHSFSTRESLCLLSRLRKTRTSTRAMPVTDVHAVFAIVSCNGYHARH